MSADPVVFRQMVDLCRDVEISLGTVRGHNCFDSEKEIRIFRADAQN